MRVLVDSDQPIVEERIQLTDLSVDHGEAVSVGVDQVLVVV